MARRTTTEEQRPDNFIDLDTARVTLQAAAVSGVREARL